MSTIWAGLRWDGSALHHLVLAELTDVFVIRWLVEERWLLLEGPIPLCGSWWGFWLGTSVPTEPTGYVGFLNRGLVSGW